MKEINRILVISRMTKYCTRAVHAGVLVAKQNEATLAVYHSTYDPFEADQWFTSLKSTQDMMSEYRSAQEEARADLDEIIAKEHAEGLEIEVIISKKDPDEEIFDIVQERGIDLLILRAHEEGLIEHFFFGRSTEKIVRKMPCSVMLVKDEEMVL